MEITVCVGKEPLFNMLGSSNADLLHLISQEEPERPWVKICSWEKVI